MKPIIIASDFHISEKPQRRFEALQDILLTDFINIVKEYDADYILCLGDVFERKDHISNRERHLLEEFVSALNDRYFIFLIGNHDVSLNNYNTISFLSHYKNVTVVDKPTTLRLYDIPYSFVPYQFLLDTVNTSMCFCHHEFKEVVNYPSKEAISIDTVGADIIVSGHIHRRVHYIGKKHLYYVGMLCQRDFRDMDCKEGLLVYNHNSFEFVDIKPRLRFEKIYVDDFSFIHKFNPDSITQYWFVFSSEKLANAMKKNLEEMCPNCICEVLKEDVASIVDEIIKKKDNKAIIQKFLERENKYPIELYLKIAVELLNL